MGAKMLRSRFCIVSFLLFSFAPPTLAEEIKCSNIDAKTHYSSSSTAAKTESGSSCKVSIDGADADTQGFPEVGAWCVGALLRNGELPIMLETGNLSVEGVGKLVGLLVLPSLDPDTHNGVSGDSIAWPGSMSDCGTFISSVDQIDEGSSLSDFHSELGVGLGDEVLNCIFSRSTGSLVKTCDQANGVTTIQLTTSFGDHTVFIPISN